MSCEEYDTALGDGDGDGELAELGDGAGTGERLAMSQSSLSLAVFLAEVMASLSLAFSSLAFSPSSPASPLSPNQFTIP